MKVKIRKVKFRVELDTDSRLTNGPYKAVAKWAEGKRWSYRYGPTATAALGQLMLEMNHEWQREGIFVQMEIEMPK